MKPILIKTYISWTLVILWMIVIFAFSAQNAAASSEVSGNISEAIYEPIIETFPETDLTEESIHVSLRNIAHFLLYLVLGGLVLNAMESINYKSWLNTLFAFLIAFLYAITDEWHQYYVPGRSFELKDLLIDSIGAIVGIFIVFVLYKWIKTRKNKIII